MSGFVEDVRASIVEHGVDPEQQTMALDKVFWSHFCTNLAPATWVLGALLVGIGLDFRTGLLAILIGNVLGCLPVALNSTIGPRTGLTQIEISRFAFGRIGTRVPSWLNWGCAVGWDAVNNVPSVLALVALAALFGLTVPFWIGLSLLVAVQLAASMYGHHVVQLVAKYLCYVLIVVFSITGIVAVLKGGSLATVHAAIKPATFVLGISMIAGFAIGFAPYSSDYTRYLPRSTKPGTIFALSFGGLALSSALIEIFGLLTAARLTDLSAAGVIAGIGALTGPFAPVALIAIAASAISINSINDNTAAYSLISTGIRIRRDVAAIITTACGFALAVAGAGKFAELFSNYLLLLLYWIAPWAGIVLTDWWMFGGAHRAPRRWGSGATIFVIVTPLTIALFSATPIYTGPIAKLLDGTDIGFFVGFFVAALSYALAERGRRAPQVPVIDIGALRSNDPAALRALAREIGAAARTTGFFSVVNHGIPEELIAAVFAQSAAFFEQPLATKERVGMEGSPAYRGYARNGYEQFDEAHPADAKESFDIGRDQNQWPDDMPGFQATLQTYYDALLALTVAIHRPIALDLGLDENFFAPAFDRAGTVARLLYYPPHPGTFDGTLHGAAPHTDYGNITFLAQDDAGGLELQMRDGRWIGIDPTPGAFVCNIGDCLMRWSNDVYVSNLHRVVNRSGRARYSVAFFGDPAEDARVECLPSCTGAARPPKYPPTTYGEYLQRRLTAAYPLKTPA